LWCVCACLVAIWGVGRTGSGRLREYDLWDYWGRQVSMLSELGRMPEDCITLSGSGAGSCACNEKTSKLCSSAGRWPAT